MQQTPEIGWLLLAVIGLFGLVHVLRALAIRVRNEVMIHDLKVRVSTLQAENFHATMLRHGMTPQSSAGEVEVIGEITPNHRRADAA